jgi:hypothetical protein
MLGPLILVPAYGRRYATGEEAIADFEAGKDFRIDGGPYCSIRDFPDQVVNIRIAPGLYCIRMP